jgi:Flp pilus assembly pilin Flp
MNNIFDQIKTRLTKSEFTPHPHAGEAGQGLVEYALLLTLVSMAVTFSISILGSGLQQTYCSVVIALDQEAPEACTGATAEAAAPEPNAGPTIMKAMYDLHQGELDLVAKADENCPYTLQVQEFGYAEMERAGSSYVFKKTFETGYPPASVTIGHPDCGWTVRAVN